MLDASVSVPVRISRTTEAGSEGILSTEESSGTVALVATRPSAFCRARYSGRLTAGLNPTATVRRTEPSDVASDAVTEEVPTNVAGSTSDTPPFGTTDALLTVEAMLVAES